MYRPELNRKYFDLLKFAVQHTNDDFECTHLALIDFWPIPLNHMCRLLMGVSLSYNKQPTATRLQPGDIAKREFHQ